MGQCNLAYNKDGGISNVFTPDGNESKVFKQLSKLPHVENLEEALSIYKNLYTKEYTGERSLSFTSDKGNTFPSYKEALKDSDGGDISVRSGDTSLITISANTNPNSREGLINNLIKADILSDERIVEGGESFLKADGHDQARQIANELIVRENAPNAKITTDGRIIIEDKVEFKAKTEQEEQLEKIYDAVKDAQPRAIGSTVNPVLGEDALKSRLVELLNSIGVKMTSIESYVKNTEQVEGVEPSAVALADISNKIIAFKNGEITMEALTEETAHFIIEAWNEGEISDLLRNIHKTDSYQKHAAQYRYIYTRENPNMSAEEIEQLVRKEVLGKELAAALVNNFSTEGKTEPQVNILRQIYNKFVEFFENLVLGDYQAKLQDLNNKVEDLLISQDVNKYLDITQFQGKKFRLYQTTPNVNAQDSRALNLIMGLLEQEKVLMQIGRGSVATIQKLESMLSTAMEKKSVSDLIGLAKRQTRYIQEAITTANRRNTTLSNEENIVFRNLNNVIRPALSQLSVSLKDDNEFRGQVTEMEDIASRINQNEGLVLNAENNILESIIDRVMQRHNLKDGVIKTKDANGDLVDMDVREHLKSSILAAKKDTNTLYSYFGQITHASDPLLNLLGSVIGDLYTNASREFNHTAKNYQKALREEGFTEKDLTKLMQEDGYVISKWDFAAFKEFLKYAKADAYLKNLDGIITNVKVRIANGENLSAELAEHEVNKALSPEEFAKNFEALPRISDEKMRLKVTSEAQSTVNDGSETVLSKAFREEKEKTYTDLGISDATRVLLKGFSEQRGQIKKNASVSKSGVTIYTTQNKYDLEFLNLQRRKASSPYTDLGKLKLGLSIDTYPSGADSVAMLSGEYLNLDRSIADEEAVVAFDMSRLTKHFVDEKNKKAGSAFNDKIDPVTHSRFLEDLADMEVDPEVTREDILDFFNLNTQVGFSKEFFEKQHESIFDAFENDPSVKDDIEYYKNLITARRAVVNQYRDANNGLNTLAEDIPLDIKKEIRTNTALIEELSSKILMHIRSKNIGTADEIEESERRAETGANEAYFGALKDNNLKSFDEQYKFTVEHMTDRNKRKVDAFLNAVKTRQIPANLFNVADKYGNDEAGVLKYAQSKLLPYYSSFAPKDLQEFYDKARNSNEKMSDLINTLNESPDVRISVSYDYLDSSDPNILNPNRDPDFKGGYQQPNLNVSPTILGKTFNFNNKNWSKVESDPRMKKLHDMHIDMQEKTLEMLGEKGTHNVYLAPQVSKGSIEKAQNILKGKNVRETASEWLQELSTYRVDEMVQGEEANGASLYKSGIRIIPKQYLRNLESASDVTQDLFHSSMLMMQQAALYKNRKEKYAEVAALYDAVSSNRRSYPDGKEADATNTYKMFRSQMDYALFGVQEQARLRVSLPILGTRDLTKVIKTLHKYKSNLSLAYKATVPLTSMLTAHTQLLIERTIGQFVDSDSANMAMREFRKISGAAISESLDLNSTSRLSIIGEYFGSFDLDRKYENAMYGKGVRTLAKAGYGLHITGNFTPLSQALLSTLYGQRIYAGKVLDYNQFKTIQQNIDNTITPKQIEGKWKQQKSLYDYIKTDNGILEYDPQLKTDLGVTDEEFNNIELGAFNKIKGLNERIDGAIPQEEKTAANRHFLMSFFVTHKSWLAIAAAIRFKGKHLNLKTGQLEEGSYLSLGGYLKDVVNKFTNKDWAAFKTAYMEADPHERLNLQRVAKEIGILSAITLLGIAATGYADDEDESIIAQGVAYMTDRLVNETSSSQFGAIGELYNSAKSPIVGISQLESMAKVTDLVSSEQVKSGRYSDVTEQQRYLIKNIPGFKEIYDLSSAKNLKSQRSSYEHFNEGSSSFNIMALLLNNL